MALYIMLYIQFIFFAMSCLSHDQCIASLLFADVTGGRAGRDTAGGAAWDDDSELVEPITCPWYGPFGSIMLGLCGNFKIPTDELVFVIGL